MALLIMLNNLLHDFAVALLLAALLVIWLAGRPSLGVPKRVLQTLYRRINGLTLACWAVIIAGGIVRMFGYRKYEWAEAAGRGQVTALAVKHAILVALVLLGVAGQLHLRKRLKR